jgi:hypothetical protein
MVAIRQVALVAVVAGLVLGCSSGSDGEQRELATGSPTASAPDDTTGPVECVEPRRSATGFPEVRGVVPEGHLWALVFGDYPVRKGQEIKIVWRMTGEGAVLLSATGPNGRRISPAWGPETHQGSNWGRPGDEWGSGWRFPEPGCWTVQLNRGTDRGTAGIRVI